MGRRGCWEDETRGVRKTFVRKGSSCRPLVLRSAVGSRPQSCLGVECRAPYQSGVGLAVLCYAASRLAVRDQHPSLCPLSPLCLRYRTSVPLPQRIPTRRHDPDDPDDDTATTEERRERRWSRVVKGEQPTTRRAGGGEAERNDIETGGGEVPKREESKRRSIHWRVSLVALG